VGHFSVDYKRDIRCLPEFVSIGYQETEQFQEKKITLRGCTVSRRRVPKSTTVLHAGTLEIATASLSSLFSLLTDEPPGSLEIRNSADEWERYRRKPDWLKPSKESQIGLSRQRMVRSRGLEPPRDCSR
jgi:hypothetical protein